MFLMNEFWERFEVQRKSLSLTRSEICARTGISVGTMNSWLSRGNTYPSVLEAAKIAKALDLSIEWLLTGREEPVANSDILLFTILENPRLLLIAEVLPLLNNTQLHALEAQITAMDVKIAYKPGRLKL